MRNGSSHIHYKNAARFLRLGVSVALAVALLASILPAAPAARAAASFVVRLSTQHFGVQFLHVQQEGQSATFTLTNGANLWYDIHVTSSPTGLQVAPADPLDDLVAAAFGDAGLLQPQGIVPIHADGSLFQNLRLKASFTGPDQQITLTLDPFSYKAAALDIVGLLLTLLGESNPETMPGLLAPGAIKDIVTAFQQSTYLTVAVSDLIAALHSVAANDLEGAAGHTNALANDLFETLSHKNELKILNAILLRAIGAALPGSAITSSLVSFSANITALTGLFLAPVNLMKYLFDLALSFGSYLFLQGEMPTVILRSVANGAALASPTPSLGQYTVYVGDANGSLLALNASGGSQRWRFKAGGESGVAVAAADGLVYVERQINFGQSSAPLYAINQSTGALVWQWIPPAAPNLGMAEESYPPAFLALSGNVVFVSSYNMLIALDALRGKVLWQYDTSDINWSITVSGETVFVMHANTWIDALDTQTGTEQWHVAVTGSPNRGPIVANNAVYFSVCPTGQRQDVCQAPIAVYAFDLGSHAQLWHYNAGTGSYTVDLQIVGKRAFLIVYSDQSQSLVTLDAQTGASLPGAHMNCKDSGSDVLPADESGYEACVTPAGNANVIKYDLASGQQQWRQSLDAGGLTALDVLAVSGGVVYVNESNYGGAESGNQNFYTGYALDANSGKIIWRHDGLIADVVAGVAVLTTGDGLCVAVNAANGAELWKVSVGAQQQGQLTPPAAILPDS